jgi:hypothetical protein
MFERLGASDGENARITFCLVLPKTPRKIIGPTIRLPGGAQSPQNQVEISTSKRCVGAIFCREPFLFVSLRNPQDHQNIFFGPPLVPPRGGNVIENKSFTPGVVFHRILLA